MDHLNTRDRISFLQYDDAQIEDSNDRIRIHGRVTIFQGEGENKEILVNRAHNKWVKNGLKGLLSYFVLSGYESSDKRDFSAQLMKIYLGTDQANATTHDLTALKNPIGASPGTAPNTTSGENLQKISDGHFRIAYMAIFNLGTVSGTVGEAALYLGMPDSLAAGAMVSTQMPAVMVSRCSVADGDFSAFDIDTSKSLAILWEVFIAYE